MMGTSPIMTPPTSARSTTKQQQQQQSRQCFDEKSAKSSTELLVSSGKELSPSGRENFQLLEEGDQNGERETWGNQEIEGNLHFWILKNAKLTSCCRLWDSRWIWRMFGDSRICASRMAEVKWRIKKLFKFFVESH